MTFANIPTTGSGITVAEHDPAVLHTETIGALYIVLYADRAAAQKYIPLNEAHGHTVELRFHDAASGNATVAYRLNLPTA